MTIKKKILLGITGSIAAYKTPDLVRRLIEADFDVRIVLTTSAKAFVTPLTLETLSQHAINEVLLEPTMQHIELAKWADVILIAPATANILVKLAHGFADDLLSAICLVSQTKLIIAPAMNQFMWQHLATQENVALLKKRGAHFLGPDEGLQACGDNGPGRLLETSVLVEYLSSYFNDQPLLNKRILITAGPTQEAVDPVRFISNRSSGKMGYRLAQMSTIFGADVTLVSGPTALSVPTCKKFIPVKTADDMLIAVENEISQQDIFIAAAAVADYEIAESHPKKIKKMGKTLSIALKPTVDILATIAQRKDKPFIVGFAAETEDLVKNAQAKRLKKGVDMMVANDVSRTDIGFDADQNEVIVFVQDKTIYLEKASKLKISEQLLRLIASYL